MGMGRLLYCQGHSRPCCPWACAPLPGAWKQVRLGLSHDSDGGLGHTLRSTLLGRPCGQTDGTGPGGRKVALPYFLAVVTPGKSLQSL